MVVFCSQHRNLIARCVSNNTTGEKSLIKCEILHHPAHLLVCVALPPVLKRHGSFRNHAKDAALVSTLEAYYHECKALGCGKEHLESIDLLIERVRKFQAIGKDKKHFHIPDTD